MTGPSALERRAAALARLRAETFDLLVIGGGINGAGIARDAAMRGLRVALVERDDFASGTSSRSSRLVHGGVRYLEHGHFHLVFESSRERRTLLRVAPHLVRPLRFTWPVYEGARVPRWKLGAGLMLYDLLSLFRNVANHEPLRAAGVLAAEPALRRDGLAGGARYYDAATDDTRLTLANVVAAIEAGAVAVNHLAVRSLARDGALHVAVAADALGDDDEIAIRARSVVNAAGPWSDELRRLEGDAGAAAVRGTKGVHVTVPRERVGNRGAVTLLAPSDGRVMFVLPAGAHTIIGTTDTSTSESPDEVRATSGDVRYLLDAVNAYFPAAALVPDDVVAAWAGIRPLVASGFTGSAASASREHAIARGPGGVISVSGGKLTTYRSMAAEVVDAAAASLGRSSGRSLTAAASLPGGDVGAIDAELAAARAVVRDDAVAERLIEAHGSRWRRVWTLAEREPALAERIVPALPYTGAEMRYAVEHELACTLADLLVRRTHLAFEQRDAGRAAARTVAALVAPQLGWTDAMQRAQLASYDREAERMFRIGE